MIIRRDGYLNKLIGKERNGLIKVVTGVRRCGKTYLLFNLFHDHLRMSGVPESHIIEVALDDRSNKKLRDPDNILEYVKERIEDDQAYYVILDEVQFKGNWNRKTEAQSDEGYKTKKQGRKTKEWIPIFNCTNRG